MQAPESEQQQTNIKSRPTPGPLQAYRICIFWLSVDLLLFPYSKTLQRIQTDTYDSSALLY